MGADRTEVLRGEVLDERTVLGIDELCRACSVTTDWIAELVEHGVLEPIGGEPAEWLFTGSSVRRTRIAMRLQRDLGVNPPGAALVLELIGEIEELRTRLRMPRGR